MTQTLISRLIVAGCINSDLAYAERVVTKEIGRGGEEELSSVNFQCEVSI